MIFCTVIDVSAGSPVALSLLNSNGVPYFLEICFDLLFILSNKMKIKTAPLVRYFLRKTCE